MLYEQKFVAAGRNELMYFEVGSEGVNPFTAKFLFDRQLIFACSDKPLFIRGSVV